MDMTTTTRLSRAVALLLGISLLLPLSTPRAEAQAGPGGNPPRAHRRVIVVNAEQPNVWTLEQAHYLLAQMHRRNLDLKATGPGALDPNEINGLDFEVMRTLLEFGATFNGADRFNNRLLTRDRSFNAERAIRLQRRRDQLADQALALNRDIARLGRERAEAENEAQEAALTARIAELTAVRDANNAEVTRLDNDLKTETGPTGELQATEPPPPADQSRLPQSSFDDAFKDVTKKLIDRFNEAPKLNASLRLENFLQMQYEIIAKQLTLLRDEVGPGERIIFLELPQTVNAAHDKANKKWAQSWWKVVGYTTPIEKESVVDKMLRQDEGKETRQPERRDYVKDYMRAKGRGSTGPPPGDEDSKNNIETVSSNEPLRETRHVVDDAIAAYGGERPPNIKCVRVSDDLNVRVFFRELDCTQNPGRYQGDIDPQDSSVRAVELIPRQSSLNVNDIKLRARSGALTVLARTLFGFGARLNFQRQRENFSQFVQQELYSSGFGKGSREFGWTFNPMPGTDRVMSGVRTTYAVLIVPAEAEALVMQSAGCYFPRSEYQPDSFAETRLERWTELDRQSRNCSEHKSFVVPIPNGGDEGISDFWVAGLEYEPAPKGEQVVLLVYGRNFPAQIGMMVDGVPLAHSIGVAQPLIRDDSTAFEQAREDLRDARVNGRIERIDSNQLVAIFDRPHGKDGTQPVITLTAPGKAKNLNNLRLRINGRPRALLNDGVSDLLFGQRATPKPDFRIDEVLVSRSRTPGHLTAAISGAGFAYGQPVFVNGSTPSRVAVDAPTFMRVEFRVPADETIRIKLVAPDPDPSKTKTAQSNAVANPALLRIMDVVIVSYDEATDEEEATLVVRIEGSGFTEELRSSVGELAVKSAAEAILKITDPEAAAIVTLTDRQTGQQVKTVVTRKTQPPK